MIATVSDLLQLIGDVSTIIPETYHPENSEMLFATADEEYVLNATNKLENGKASDPHKGICGVC